jgi:hypothetical protein
MIPMILIALMNAPYNTTVDIVDSRDDSTSAYIVVNDTCKVKIKKIELKDFDTLTKKVEKQCGYLLYSL